MKPSVPPVIVSLDIGSSSVRSVAYDGTGEMLADSLASAQYEVRVTPDGGAELDADALVEDSVLCLRQTEAKLRDAGIRPEAVGVCTFWHSLIGVGASEHAVTPVYMWSDTRSAAHVAELRRTLDEAACHRRTGCVFHTSYFPAKLLWLREQQPAVFDSAQHWMSPGEYLMLRLFGERACSYSMASGTGLFDHDADRWDDELLAACGIDEGQLSPVVEQSGSTEAVRPEFREALANLATVPWFPALGDGACSNVGSGGVAPSRATLMIGTSGAMRVMVEHEPEPPWGVWKYRADRQRCLLGGALSNGGNLTDWLAKSLALDDWASCEEQLPSLPPDGHGLTVLPFLSGERSPNWRPEATGAILGLRLSTEPIHILQAAFEAVGYRFALLAELLDEALPGVEKYLASGGVLLASPYWMQMLADILSKPVIESTVPEASSRGAALMALEAMGALSSIAEAPFGFGQTYEPNAERSELYAAGLERHREAYDVLAPIPSAPSGR